MQPITVAFINYSRKRLYPVNGERIKMARTITEKYENGKLVERVIVEDGHIDTSPYTDYPYYPRPWWWPDVLYVGDPPNTCGTGSITGL